jgi:hypothetical protein
MRDEARQADVGFEPKPVDGLPHVR